MTWIVGIQLAYILLNWVYFDAPRNWLISWIMADYIDLDRSSYTSNLKSLLAMTDSLLIDWYYD